MSDGCFHCGLDFARERFVASVKGIDQEVCCLGCKAVAELIDQSGMSQYYDLREAPLGEAVDIAPQFEQYDAVAEHYVQQLGKVASTTVFVDGMHCSACCWLVESRLNRHPSVSFAKVDPLSHRLSVSWDLDQMRLSDILSDLAAIGYRPEPLTENSRPERDALRQSMKRLVVASVGMMQVMMFAIGLYSGDVQGMAPAMEHFLRLVSLIVTTPVVLYSARPIFSGAMRGLWHKQPGMDVPVALAIALAFSGSVYSTFTRGTDVWFDSVSMFIFFLTLARHLELVARTTAARRADGLRPLLPGTAEIITDRGLKTVSVTTVQTGDWVRVLPGGYIPVDGILGDMSASVDEAVLTGESEPQFKTRGMQVLAGSLCLDNAIDVQASAVGATTRLAQIQAISRRAIKPKMVEIADRVASYFVSAVLLIATLVAASWAFIDPDRAFVVTLSVLVVTCPCALALATPTVFAAASRHLADLGLLLRRTDALSALSKVDTVIFDKTGTLTHGKPSITCYTSTCAELTEARARDIASALEQHSSHPLALAFKTNTTGLVSKSVEAVPGCGIAGTIDHRVWYLGSRQYVTERSGAEFTPAPDDGQSHVYLASDKTLTGMFTLHDDPRPECRALVDRLTAMGLDVRIASGDRRNSVAQLAATLGVHQYASNQSPEDKLAGIQSLQAIKHRVLMVGDGINDGPVLSAADVSIAPAHGSDLAQHQADLIMTSPNLLAVADAISTARHAQRIIRQNLTWAIGYNSLALPAAALGVVPTWLAAIGMSASSLIVVINAMRIRSIPPHDEIKHAEETLAGSMNRHVKGVWS